MITAEEFKLLEEGDQVILTDDGRLLEEYCIPSTLTNTIQFVMHRKDDLIYLRNRFFVKQEHIAKIVKE